MTSVSKPLNQRLRAALRMLWLRSPERSKALAAYRVGRGQYKCGHCSELFGVREIQIDHTVACGTLAGVADLPVFVDRLFNGQQIVLCRDCHKVKTVADRKMIKGAKNAVRL